MSQPDANEGAVSIALLRAKELYWTVTRAVGLGHLHDGSDAWSGGVSQKTRELYWTATRAVGLGHLHDGRPPKLVQLAEALHAVQFRLEEVQIRLDVLRVQSEVAAAARAEMSAALAPILDNLEEPKTRDLQPISLGRDILFRAPWGVVLVPSEDVSLVTYLWGARVEPEPGTLKVMLSLIAEGDRVIDVGANIGVLLVPVARKVGAKGEVVALEPGARAGELLSKTVIANGLADRTKLHACAAGGESGVARLYTASTIGHFSLLESPGGHSFEEVPVRPLDELVPSGQNVRLVKIDVEGFELQVWRGMRRILRDSPSLAAIVEFGPSHLKRAFISPTEWLATFEQDGFVPYEIVESSGAIRRLRPLKELEAVNSINLLMLRQPLSEIPQLILE